MPLPRNKRNLVKKPKKAPAAAIPDDPDPTLAQIGGYTMGPARPPSQKLLNEFDKLSGKFITEDSPKIGFIKMAKICERHVREQLPNATELEVAIAVADLMSPESLDAIAKSIGVGTKFTIEALPDGMAGPSNATGVARSYLNQPAGGDLEAAIKSRVKDGQLKRSSTSNVPEGV